MQRIEMVRLVLEDRHIEPGRPGQVSFLMTLKRLT
jgi:hypothetical protein